MHPIAKILLWEMAVRGRWQLPGYFLLGNALPVLIYSHLGSSLIRESGQVSLNLHFTLLQITIFQFAIGIVVAQGPLSRLFAAPISTAALVAWNLLSGSLLLGLEVAAAAAAYNWLFQAGWPIWGPALFAAAAWAVSQIVINLPARTPSHYLLATAPLVALYGYLQSRYGRAFSMPRHHWLEVTAGEVATLLGVIGLAYFVTTAAVARYRCGEGLPALGIWERLVGWRQAIRARTRPDSAPFGSPAHAQRWHEWRVKGAVLPAIVIMAMIAGVADWLLDADTWQLPQRNVSKLHEGFLAGGGLLSIAAAVAGLVLGISSTPSARSRGDRTVRDAMGPSTGFQMGSFQATLPLSNDAFAHATLCTAAKSAAVAWGIWAAAFGLFWLVLALIHQTPETLVPEWIGAWYLPLTLLGPWIGLTSAAALGLTGRAWLVGLVGTWGALSLVGMEIVYRRLAPLAWQGPLRLIVTVGGPCVILGAAVWAFAAARRRHLLGAQALWLSAAVWLGIVLFAIALRPVELPATAYPAVLAFAALVVLPLATLPLALRWNRHR